MQIHDFDMKDLSPSLREMVRQLFSIVDSIRGKENAKTSSELMTMMGYPPTATNQRLREAAKVLLCEFGVPLISCSKGFFRADNESEINEYIENLEHRMNGISRDIEACKNARSRYQTDPRGVPDLQKSLFC